MVVVRSLVQLSTATLISIKASKVWTQNSTSILITILEMKSEGIKILLLFKVPPSFGVERLVFWGALSGVSKMILETWIGNIF